MKKNNYKKCIQPSELVEMLSCFKQLLFDYRDYIDSLNVFPVPDGDTGANMYFTMESVMAELDGLDKKDDMQAICKAATKGAVMGARGNSGVLLSQVLKGFLDTFKNVGELDAKVFVEGATHASKCAYEAVSEPVEGTMLTVIREISENGAKAFEAGADLGELSTNFQTAGVKSLQNTPNLLEALKNAGVVDAGGAGVVLLFDALVFVVTGEAAPPPPETANVLSNVEEEKPQSDKGTRYEVMFLLNAQESKIPVFRQSWEQLGDSIVISGAEEIWSCHIHTDEIGKSIEAGIACGVPQDIRVTDLHEQVNHNDQTLGFHDPTKEFVLLDTQLGGLELEQAMTHIVVAGQGEGMAKLFGSLGARAMVIGGQTQNPSAKVFLDTLEQLEAEQVVILPNNSNICAVAHSVAKQSEKLVSVVETKTIPEGLSVLVAYDPLVSAESNADKMSQAKEDVASGQVTKAVRDSEAHGVSEGDFIGLDDKEILISSTNLVGAVCDLLKKLIVPSHELLMLVSGQETTESESQKIVACLEQNYPELEVELVNGGQDLYHYYIGLE